MLGTFEFLLNSCIFKNICVIFCKCNGQIFKFLSQEFDENEFYQSIDTNREKDLIASLKSDVPRYVINQLGLTSVNEGILVIVMIK